ncbi:hypothetical protein DPEC_G00169490 [Dallia pectoralis]|uniref:Uncharacterized protein n=1 Tax=Dallia pectoralis TaxID=75939 RepID=A0ACC2GD24_DALPE|nr:hypothetical protein DPEC_G00169490 [Dallia pectoralis]
MEDNELHWEDTEKLRQKLALLQKEYSRTVKRLQRAERSDAERKHARSRISNLQDQGDPGSASSSYYPALPSISLGSPAMTVPGLAIPLGPTGVVASCPGDPENSRGPSVCFLLPVDDSFPLTPEPKPDPLWGHRRSPALRLRSRRSRLRWEKRGRGGNGESAEGSGLLESCTLVEGLPFPVEYYVRTTRRMASSQSHRDLQAIILSQLKRGSHRRSRRQMTNTHTLPAEHTNDSQSLSQRTVDSMTNHTPGKGESANERLTSEVGTNPSEHLPSRGCGVRPIRGRRGRGRGRGRRLGCSLSLEPNSPSSGLDHTVTPASQPVPGVVVPERLPHSGGAGEQLYPIFRKHHPPERSNESVRSLLRSSSPRPDTQAHRPHIPSLFSGEPALHPGSLGCVISTFDLQDFHLPDDQFGQLKLQKLCSSSLPEPEPFSPYNMRRRRANGLLRSDRAALATPFPDLLPRPLSLPVCNRLRPVGSVEPSVDHNEGQPEGLHLKDYMEQSTDCQPIGTLWSDLPVDQPIGDQLSDIPVDQPIGDQLSALTEDQPIGDQLSALILDQPIGDQLSDLPVDQQIGDQLSTLTLDQPLRDQLSDLPVDQSINIHSVDRWTRCSFLQTEADTDHPTKSSTEFPSIRPETDANSSSFLLPSPSLRLLSSSPSAHTHHKHALSFPLTSSSPLPSLGVTPDPVLPSSPPTLTLPLPASPSTQTLSPPPLSPCPSTTLPPCPPSQVDSLSRPTPLPVTHPRRHTPPPSPTPLSPSNPPQLPVQPAGSLREGGEGRSTEEVREDMEGEREMDETEESVLMLTHTLNSPAGGSLVDACCVSWPLLGVCVAVAGDREVCVWGQTATPEWRRLHTWNFIEPVISVFPVPDAPGLLCVTLGQLEIREARVLCCSSLSQTALCEGEVQTVMGVPNARLVSSSHSESTPSLQVYTLSTDGSLQTTWFLVSPTERVQNLAAVEGQADALIGSTHGGHLVLWNVTTGHLLRSLILGDCFMDTVCLHGYSLCGVLFVLLQHPSLPSLGDVDERKGGALFSLVAINPLTGAIAPATRVVLPKACLSPDLGLVEVDVRGSGVVGVLRSGSVCVWQLDGCRGLQGEWLPGLGCHIARWADQGTLLTAHLNGDVCLHRYRPVHCSRDRSTDLQTGPLL